MNIVYITVFLDFTKIPFYNVSVLVRKFYFKSSTRVKKQE